MLYSEAFELLSNIIELSDCNEYYEKLRIGLKTYEGVITKECGEGSNLLSYYINEREKILDIYRDWAKGKIQSSSTKMRNWIVKHDFLKNRIIEIPANTILYRARKLEEKNLTEDDMFHIPFNMRDKVGNNRFSVSGFPCLYLADLKKCCVDEIGLQENDCYFARYTTKEPIQMYDFVFPEKTYWKEDEMEDMLKFFIFLYASSFSSSKNEASSSSKEVKFFPNYVIPQLVTAAIAANKTGKTGKDSIRAIRYQSVKDKDGINYMFIPNPPNFYKKIYQDEKLKNKFVIEVGV